MIVLTKNALIKLINTYDEYFHNIQYDTRPQLHKVTFINYYLNPDFENTVLVSKRPVSIQHFYEQQYDKFLNTPQNLKIAENKLSSGEQLTTEELFLIIRNHIDTVEYRNCDEENCTLVNRRFTIDHIIYEINYKIYKSPVDRIKFIEQPQKI